MPGFTARAERLDPEDVRAILARYYARLRVEIGAFGGTVEKFIGDAVVAVFGAPIAHGDDPQRALRAAVAVCAAVREMNAADPELNLEVRVGVNTGEAIVSVASAELQLKGKREPVPAWLALRTCSGPGELYGEALDLCADPQRRRGIASRQALALAAFQHIWDVQAQVSVENRPA